MNKNLMYYGLSINKTLEITKCMRSLLRTCKLFKPDLKGKLRSINHDLDRFLILKNLHSIKS